MTQPGKFQHLQRKVFQNFKKMFKSIQCEMDIEYICKSTLEFVNLNHKIFFQREKLDRSQSLFYFIPQEISPSSWLESCACTTKLQFYCTEPFCALNIYTVHFLQHRTKLEKVPRSNKTFCTEPFFATKQRIWKICYTTARGSLCISHTR